MIDTNIAIHARDETGSVLERLSKNEGAILLSALSMAELQRGVFKDPQFGPLRRSRLELLLQRITIVPFDTAAAIAYGQIIAHCGWVKGRDFDRMIAGHAISTSSVLITDNFDDFRDIPGLKFENWAVR